MRLSKLASKTNGSLKGADVDFDKVSIDSRTLVAGDVFFAIKGEHFDGHDYVTQAIAAGASAIVHEDYADFEVPSLKVSDTTKALGIAASIHRSRFKVPLIAITGSCGKTTVKEMCAQILGKNAKVLKTKGNLNNQFGLPLTLFELGPQHEYAVVELGAAKPNDIQELCEIAKPDVALVTMIAPAHIESFGSIKQVVKTKSDIYRRLNSNGIAIFNCLEPNAKEWRTCFKELLQYSYGTQESDVWASDVQTKSRCIEFCLHVKNKIAAVRLPILGEHNVQNALGAATIAHALGISIEQIVEGLNGFVGAQGRMCLIESSFGAIIDDSYNANPESMKAALEVLALKPGIKVAVFGEMAELGPQSQSFHKQVGKFAKELGVDHLYSVGLDSHAYSLGFGEGALHFSNQSELLKHINQLSHSERVFLVKGSRSAKMNQVVESLTNTA